MAKIIITVVLLSFVLCYASAYAESSSKMKTNDTLVFARIQEPNENAFTILIPKGWKTDGGIIRINPLNQGGSAQSIAAKLNFLVKRDDDISVGLHWFPEILYCDARKTPAGQMGLFPPGSNYNGMPVYPLMSAEEYLLQVVFPQTHQNATDLKLIDVKKSPKLIEKYHKNLANLQAMTNMMFDFSYDSAIVTVTYNENGVAYKEKMITVIEDMGQIGFGMWLNKETFHFRAPINEFDKIEPIAYIIQSSIKINEQWLAGEIKGQIQRGEIALKTQRYINDINKQIMENRIQTNEQIRNDMYLNLTSQEEYINPYTKEVEVGSNEWKNRWINASGDVIYSNNTDYNPNYDDSIKRTDYKLCPVKPRK
jgi:hypothetical protein